MKKIEENLKILLDYIMQSISDVGIVPTVRDMCSKLGVTSTSTINYYLKALEQRGYIIRSYNKNRAIELTEKTKKMTTPANMNSIPVVGNVAAGIPILAEENRVGEYMFSKNLFNADEMYMLVVHGDSMIDAGIIDGDYVVVKKSETAQNGQIVVALIEDSATVKTFYREANCIRLQPENPLYQPIISPNISVIGIVIGVVRKV